MFGKQIGSDRYSTLDFSRKARESLLAHATQVTLASLVVRHSINRLGNNSLVMS